MTDQPPSSRYPAPALAEMPDDIRARIEAVQEKSVSSPTSS